jgi:antitoxin component YwqK of YwqJK toxin-antitoxin module
MRKTYFIVFALLFLFSCDQGTEFKPGQGVKFDQLEKRNGIYYLKDVEKPYSGKAMKYFENGKISYLENLKDGKQNGKVYNLYENGQIKDEWSFKNGEPHGKCRSWYQDGGEAYERKYKNGQPVGKWITWFEKSDRKKSEEVYTNGKCKGKFFEYNDKGKVINEIEFTRK